MEIEIIDSSLSGYSEDAKNNIKEAIEEYSEILIEETDKVEKTHRSRTSSSVKEVVGSHVLEANSNLKENFRQSKRDKIIIGILQVFTSILSVVVGWMWDSDANKINLPMFILIIAVTLLILFAQFYYTVLKER
ncbi:hypothetical protein O3611_04400 [Streptococcus sp. 27098_8_91]|uniref:hypothetical protein n=1 Tax=Streptococcus TaxID=1301 RepID=UPI00352C97CB